LNHDIVLRLPLCSLLQHQGLSMSDILFHYTKKNALLFVVFLLMYETSTYIANDMIMPGMLQVVHSFSAPDSFVPASLTAFILGGASLQLFLGPLSDRYGRRPVMLCGAIFFFLSTIFIGLSTSIHEFILARFLQGMGLCFISVVGYATLQEMFTEKYAVRIVSIMSNITILAPLIGPLLGSLVIEIASWRMIFHIIDVSALISLIGLWKYMPETIDQTKIDGSLYPATPLKLSVLLKNYYFLLSDKKFMSGSLALGLSFAPLIAWIGTAPLILIKAAHLRVLYYGLWQIPVFLMTFIGTMYMRRFLDTVSLIKLARFGTYIIGSSLIFMSIALLFDKHYIWLIIGLSIYSFGLGFTTGPINRLILFFTNVPKGTTSALASILTMIIIGLANQIGGWVYASYNNLYFGLFCTACSIAYCTAFYLMDQPSTS